MDYNTPINFFKSLFKIRKETLDGTEPISLAYLNPNTGAMNTGLYCTTQDIADLAQGSSLPLTPKIYKAKMGQFSTNAPFATVLNSGDSNYLGTLTWTRSDVGVYTTTFSGITTSNTLISISGMTPDQVSSFSTICSSNTITLLTFSSGSAADGAWTAYITIEYYGA